MKNSLEKVLRLNNRQGNLLQERIELNEMISSMEKQIRYLTSRLDVIEIELEDIKELRTHIIDSDRNS